MPRAALLSLHARVEGVEPVDLGAPVARPAVGASLPGLRRPEARLRALLAGAGCPRTRRAGGARSRWPSGSTRISRDKRMTDRELGARAAGRQRAPVRDDDGHARDPLGRRAGAGRLGGRRPDDRAGRRSPRAGPALPPRLRAGDRRRLRALGRDLAARRRPARSRRSKGRCSRFARRSATSGCSPRTSRRLRAPTRPPRAGAAAAERRCLLPAPARRGARAARPARGPARAALDVPRLARSAARRGRDPRHLATGAAHRPDRGLVATLPRGARGGRGRGRRAAAAGARAADRGGLGAASGLPAGGSPSRSQRAVLGDVLLGSSPRWPATPSTFTTAPGTWAASHSPWAGGTSTSVAPYRTSTGIVISPTSKPHGSMCARSSSAQPPTPRTECSAHDSRITCARSLRVSSLRSASLRSKSPSTAAGSSATPGHDLRVLRLELAHQDLLAGLHPAELLDVLRVHAGEPVVLLEPRGLRTAPRRRTQAARTTRSGRRAAQARAWAPPPEPPVTPKRSKPRWSASAATSSTSSTIRLPGRRVDLAVARPGRG